MVRRTNIIAVFECNKIKAVDINSNYLRKYLLLSLVTIKIYSYLQSGYDKVILIMSSYKNTLVMDNMKCKRLDYVSYRFKSILEELAG